METVTLPTATIRGDEWSQALTLNNAGRDFSTLSVSTSVYRGGLLLSAPVVASAISNVVTGSALITLDLTGTQTQAMPASTYIIRVRVQTSDWGPYTPIDLKFDVVN